MSIHVYEKLILFLLCTVSVNHGVGHKGVVTTVFFIASK